MLERIYFKVLKDISPEKLVVNALKKRGRDFSGWNVVSLGKAAVPMLEGFAGLYNFNFAFVIAPEGADSFSIEMGKNVRLIYSTHPEISSKSKLAAEELIAFLKGSISDTVFLISGGGSALMELPLDFLTLEEVIETSRYLVESGIPIEDINFARIHLSKIKGGGLLNHLNGNGEAFVICDVLGDRIDRVSSAPLYPVERDYRDFVNFADKIDLWQFIPFSKRKRFLTCDFRVEGKKIPHHIAASNSLVVSLFGDYLAESGKTVLTFKDFIRSEVETEADKIFDMFKKELVNGKTQALVFGGEATVKVKGKGKGGRTLELCLRFLKRLYCLNVLPEIEIISATTDGIDGNSGCAGVYLPFDKIKKIMVYENPETMDYYLENSDSFAFFEKYESLIKTGYTGNNLLDVFAVLKV